MSSPAITSLSPAAGYANAPIFPDRVENIDPQPYPFTANLRATAVAALDSTVRLPAQTPVLVGGLELGSWGLTPSGIWAVPWYWEQPRLYQTWLGDPQARWIRLMSPGVDGILDVNTDRIPASFMSRLFLRIAPTDVMTGGTKDMSVQLAVMICDSSRFVVGYSTDLFVRGRGAISIPPLVRDAYALFLASTSTVKPYGFYSAVLDRHKTPMVSSIKPHASRNNTSDTAEVFSSTHSGTNSFLETIQNLALEAGGDIGGFVMPGDVAPLGRDIPPCGMMAWYLHGTLYCDASVIATIV